MKKLTYSIIILSLLVCLSFTSSYAQKPYKKGKVTTNKVTLKRTNKKGNKKTFNTKKKNILPRAVLTVTSGNIRQTRQNKTHNRRKKMTELCK